MNRKNNMVITNSGSGNRSNNDTRWSDRYSYGGGRITVATGAGPRWLPALTVLLLAAVVLLGIFGGQAMAYRSKSEETFVYRMLTECNDAISQCGSLSRSNGSESPAILGQIRASVHAVDVLNEVHNTVQGSFLIEPSVFSNIYTIIDAYSSNLKLGNVTIGNLTELDLALNGLRDLVLALQ